MRFVAATASCLRRELCVHTHTFQSAFGSRGTVHQATERFVRSRLTANARSCTPVAAYASEWFGAVPAHKEKHNDADSYGYSGGGR